MVAKTISMDPPRAGVLLKRARNLLRRHKIDDPLREARLIMGHVTGCLSVLDLDTDAPLSRDTRRAFYRLLFRRCRHEPFSRLCGRREFWSLPFMINEHTLDPRPDSETLIEAVMDYALSHTKNHALNHNKDHVKNHTKDRYYPFSIIDLGTGSGCLLLSLLTELPRGRGIGIDISRSCLDVARRNAMALGCDKRAHFIACDWTRPIQGNFDIIISNPPYIARRKIAMLDPDVRDYDPLMALNGGSDGIASYRKILPDIRRMLSKSGRAFLEIDPDIASAVQTLAERVGLRVMAVRRDLGARQRCLVLQDTGSR